jgi:hypothetical protein
MDYRGKHKLLARLAETGFIIERERERKINYPFG